MKLTIQFITPDGSLIVPNNTVAIDEIAIIGTSTEVVENMIRSIAHGYGLPHGWEVERVRAFVDTKDLNMNIHADVCFRKMIYDGLTLSLVRMLRHTLNGYAQLLQIMPMSSQAYKEGERQVREIEEKLKNLGL